MLEKIGLPAKPSMRGSNWVIDASHCQGCSSQFTFINRKHHCRRCGGLFCGTCSGQRMILRGQGDSPVRICEPCKKLEEAERFELRHGIRNRNIKGSSKPSSSSNQEDELLAQLLGGTSKNLPKLLPNESSLNPKPSSSSSSTNQEDEIIRSLSIPNDITADVTPEELRQKAVEEKKLHRVLKSRGKANDALQAFKRGRELERQADALETALRKNRRLASKNVERNSNNNIVKKESVKKDDLASELRDLGWNDVDLHETGRSNPVSLEGELSQLIGEITKKPLGEEGEKKKKKGIDNSQVIALKRKALAYKKEGKLQEAKEELKKAKVLERELEERLILGDSDESDDELGALMRQMDQKGKNNDDFSDLGLNEGKLGFEMGGFDLEKLLSGGDIDQFGDFDVSNDDLNDPSLNSDLKSFGWSDDDDDQEQDQENQESVVEQVQAIKKEAVVQKRAGNMSEAMALLKKAKLLEKKLQEVSSKENSPDIKIKNSETGHDVNPLRNNKPVTKSRVLVQRELLAVKKRALALRREGKVEESERELERGRVLERELEDIDNGPKVVINQDLVIQNPLELNDEIGETEVSETDMRDPDLNSVLRNLGWDEDEKDEVAPQKLEITKKPLKKSKFAIQRELLAVKKQALVLRREGKVEESERELERGKVLERELQEFDTPIVQIQNPIISEDHEIENTEVSETDMKDPDLNSVLKNLGWDENEDPVEKEKVVKKPLKKSKFAIQRELLAIKKNALALRREGKTEESERELERGKLLEEELQELETEPKIPIIADVASVIADVAPVEVKRVRKKSKGEIQRELLVLKRKALQLRREGREEEAESELEKAKELERELAELEASSSNVIMEKNENVIEKSDVVDPEILSVMKNLGYDKNESDDVAVSHSLAEKVKESGDTRNKAEFVNVINEPVFEEPVVLLSDENSLKYEILMHKRKALALKREGKLSEAKEELKQAKILEKNLEQNTNFNTNINMNKSVSMKEPAVQEVVKPKPVPTRKPVSGRDRFKIQQESLSHKRNALKLRREGKIEESERESELAKSLEAQLEEMNGSSGADDVSADVMVEDLLDPEMMSALRSIGWGDVGAGGSRRVEERESKVSEVERERGERVRMEEEIKREKMKAVGLKRAGKTKEAMEVLRNAKMMEKKLGLGN